MASLGFKQVDVFTQKPFWCNPVAVVLGAEKLAPEEMQRIASWTHLSETTFVLPPSLKEADYRLRIFSPRQELPFAGHPTIGSAHAVIESGYAAPRAGKLRQECLAGLLDLSVETTEQGTKIMVEAPPARVSALDKVAAKILSRGLGAPLAASARPLRVEVGIEWLVADMGDAVKVASLQPDMNVLAALSGELQVAGVTVFGRAEKGSSALHVRSFAPAQGIPEDPVCGSGNASVAAFLIHSGLMTEFGSAYTARQGMQVGRDGKVSVQIQGNTIRIGGYAVTCVDGTLRVD